MKPIIWLIKKSEYLSALSIRLVFITGKSNVPIHPKHLLQEEEGLWYKYLLSKKSVVLDAGCGSGQHSIRIAHYVKRVVGLDYDPKNLEISQKSAKEKKVKNVEFIRADLEKEINLKKEQFDLVILFDVLEHINKRQFFLKETKKLLKKNGKVIVVIPNQDTSWKKLQRKYGILSYSDPDHKIEYTEKSIKKELVRAGFVIERIIPSSYDTPWVGFIDVIGGISLSLYRRLSKWKKDSLVKHPENCSGFQIVATKEL